MREAFAKCAVVLGVGLAAMTVQGCKKKAAPASVQPVVRSAPQVQRESPVRPLPVEHVDTGVSPRADQARRRRVGVQPEPVQDAGAQAEAAAAAQRQQDAALLQQQREASQKQQQELDQDIQQTVKRQQEVQGEPRIQDAAPGPGVGPGAGPGQTTPPSQPQS
jgi:hypothetical protein